MDWLEEFNEDIVFGAMEWIEGHPATLVVGCSVSVFLCSIACCLAPFLWVK